MNKYFLHAFLIVAIINCNAQELARRPLLGIQMEKVTADTKRIMELPSEKGVLVKSIIPNSSAEKAGLKTGDVLLKINSVEVNSPDEAVKLVGTYKGGDQFSYEIIRDKKLQKGNSSFKEYRREEYKDIDMEYSAVKSVNGIQRMIISKPKNIKNAPVVVYLGGIGCYSLDNAMDTSRNETQFLNAMTRAGYVCVRAEKPGVGDNTACKSCAEIGFKEELDGYVNTVRSIKKYSYVDSNRIYVFGHSMGGVMAPLVAQQTNLAGIIAYGTIGSNFMEYLLKTRRTIGEAYSWPPDETDAYVKEYCECASYFFIEKMNSDKAALKNRSCKEYLSVLEYRSRKYNDELYDLNIPLAWKNFNGKALLMWGEGDFIASKEDHKIIAEAINYYHPGNATFAIMAKSTHNLSNAASFQEATKNEGSFNKQIPIQILQWLKSVA
jgi:uncharacterized protein